MEVTDLLRKMVAIPSVSKNEAGLSSFIYDYLKERGFGPRLCGDGNVYFSAGKGMKTLLFNSHIDTVPVCPGWDGDPFKLRESGGRLYGLGANDAKASVAAMMDAVIAVADSPDLGGKVIFAASVQEETLNIGIQQLMEKIGNVDSVVIGEPTGLDICISMRGLVILKLLAGGKSAHASRPSEGKNAIYEAAGDIERLKKLKFPKRHPALDFPSISVTMISGGTKSNVIPAECGITLDVRTTPVYDNEKIIDMIRAGVKSKVEIVSKRLIPKATPEKEKIVLAAKKANPHGKVAGFRAMCDWVFIGAPGIIMGPGRTFDSHTANESIALKQVEKASGIYRKLALAYFG